MEWNVRAAPDEILIQLAAMQAELGLWRKGWEAVEQSEALRMLLARRTREMSDRVLELSGLLKQPAA